MFTRRFVALFAAILLALGMAACDDEVIEEDPLEDDPVEEDNGLEDDGLEEDDEMDGMDDEEDDGM